MCACGWIKDGGFIKPPAPGPVQDGAKGGPTGVTEMKHIHFIGIGGYSMSGLAILLHSQGFSVSGSDVRESSRTQRARAAGVRVYIGHAAAQVAGADEVVYNTDIPPDNPERRAALKAGIPLVHRSEVLARALQPYRSITVSGTHGKTTTTSMIGTILAQCGYDPTVLVGGEVPAFGGTVRIGRGSWAVAEADESDGTFLRYQPTIAVATNVEPEHLDHFGGSFDNLVAAFSDYLGKVPADGVAVVGVDNPVLARLAGKLAVPVVGYGLHPGARVRAEAVSADGEGSRLTLVVDGVRRAEGRIGVPGRHNVLNALAAVAAAHRVGIGWAEGLAALEHFRNAARRLEVLWQGECRVIDDYAHHPTEIAATLDSARQLTRGRLIALFQPQRYVRTRNLWDQFVTAFGEADEVFLTDIYAPPGEAPIPGVTGKRLAEAIGKARGRTVGFAADMFDLVPVVVSLLKPGDTFLTMGAGNVYQVAEKVASELNR